MKRIPKNIHDNMPFVSFDFFASIEPNLFTCKLGFDALGIYNSKSRTWRTLFFSEKPRLSHQELFPRSYFLSLKLLGYMLHFQKFVCVPAMIPQKKLLDNR